MANDSKRIGDLDIATTLSANDRVVVLTSPYANGSGGNVQTTTADDFATYIARLLPLGSGLSVNGSYDLKLTLPGPYANDTAANTAGVALHDAYYTSAGVVRVRVA